MKDKLQQWWIRHLYKKACKAMARFDNAIGKDTKNLFMKELLNRVYGTKCMGVFYNNEVNFGSILKKIQRDENYADTDSLKDNKYYVKWSNRTGNQKGGD